MKKVVLGIVFICATVALVFGLWSVNDEPEYEDVREKISVFTDDISREIKKGISFEEEYELDFDDEDEEINVKIVKASDYEEKMVITAGEYEREIETFDAVIEKVYVCDIDTEDDVKDIAIITCEVSGDPRMHILKYEKNLPVYKFNTGEILDSCWLGYATSYYFNVDDDGIITMEEQTSSNAMWSVLKTYRLDSAGVFNEEVPEYYEILPDFMEEGYANEELMGEEKEKWQRGYAKAYAKYSGEDIVIEEGEYFKPVYDDGNNRIYIEKENGEKGWIPIPGYDINKGRNELNEYLFFVAG